MLDNERQSRNLHRHLSNDGYKLGDYDAFRTAMKDENKRKNFYKNITSDGIELGDYDTFSSIVGYQDHVEKTDVLGRPRDSRMEDAPFKIEEQPVQGQAMPTDASASATSNIPNDSIQKNTTDSVQPLEVASPAIQPLEVAEKKDAYNPFKRYSTIEDAPKAEQDNIDEEKRYLAMKDVSRVALGAMTPDEYTQKYGIEYDNDLIDISRQYLRSDKGREMGKAYAAKTINPMAGYNERVEAEHKDRIAKENAEKLKNKAVDNLVSRIGSDAIKNATIKKQNDIDKQHENQFYDPSVSYVPQAELSLDDKVDAVVGALKDEDIIQYFKDANINIEGKTPDEINGIVNDMSNSIARKYYNEAAKEYKLGNFFEYLLANTLRKSILGRVMTLNALNGNYKYGRNPLDTALEDYEKDLTIGGQFIGEAVPVLVDAGPMKWLSTGSKWIAGKTSQVLGKYVARIPGVESSVAERLAFENSLANSWARRATTVALTEVAPRAVAGTWSMGNYNLANTLLDGGAAYFDIDPTDPTKRNFSLYKAWKSTYGNAAMFSAVTIPGGLLSDYSRTTFQKIGSFLTGTALSGGYMTMENAMEIAHEYNLNHGLIDEYGNEKPGAISFIDLDWNDWSKAAGRGFMTDFVFKFQHMTTSPREFINQFRTGELTNAGYRDLANGFTKWDNSWNEILDQNVEGGSEIAYYMKNGKFRNENATPEENMKKLQDEFNKLVQINYDAKQPSLALQPIPKQLLSHAAFVFSGKATPVSHFVDKDGNFVATFDAHEGATNAKITKSFGKYHVKYYDLKGDLIAEDVYKTDKEAQDAMDSHTNTMERNSRYATESSLISFAKNNNTTQDALLKDAVANTGHTQEEIDAAFNKNVKSRTPDEQALVEAYLQSLERVGIPADKLAAQDAINDDGTVSIATDTKDGKEVYVKRDGENTTTIDPATGKKEQVTEDRISEEEKVTADELLEEVNKTPEQRAAEEQEDQRINAEEQQRRFDNALFFVDNGDGTTTPVEDIRRSSNGYIARDFDGNEFRVDDSKLIDGDEYRVGKVGEQQTSNVDETQTANVEPEPIPVEPKQPEPIVAEKPIEQPQPIARVDETPSEPIISEEDAWWNKTLSMKQNDAINAIKSKFGVSTGQAVKMLKDKKNPMPQDDGSTKMSIKEPGVVRDEQTKDIDESTMNELDKIAKRMGVKVKFVDFVDEEDSANAMYEDGVITIQKDNPNPVKALLGHEMMHHIREKSPAAYNDFMASLKNAVGIAQWNRAIAKVMYNYRNAGGISYSNAVEEVAADFAGSLLNNSKRMERFTDYADKDDLSAMIDWVKDAYHWLNDDAISDKVKGGDIGASSKFAMSEKDFNRLQRKLEKAYARAEEIEEDQTTINKAVEENSVPDQGSFEGKVKGKVEKDGGTPTKTSVKAAMDGAGFESWYLDDNEREHPIVDDKGNVVVKIGNKVFSGEKPVTIADLKGVKDSILNHLIEDAKEVAGLSEENADKIYDSYAKLVNAYLTKGLKKNGGMSEMIDTWQWVGDTVYKTVATNGDDQYSKSIDITKVCKKNEAVIKAISELQRKVGYGITPGQIMDIYLEGIEQDYQVPCPVCYVFSRYIRNGKYATAAIKGMQKYGKHLKGGSDEWSASRWYKEYEKCKEEEDKYSNEFENADKDVVLITEKMDEIGKEILSGKLSKKEIAERKKEIKKLDDRYRAALNVVSQKAMKNWITSFAIQEKNNKWILRDDSYAPEDMDDFKNNALDLRLTSNTMIKYPSIQRLRKSGGAAAGKEITFASNNDLGDVAMGLGYSTPEDMENYYLKAMNATSEKEKEKYLKEAKKKLESAVKFAQQQTLRGGQRMWSWSDNIERLSGDVAMNLMQMDMLGGALQSYSKQLEGIDLVASMNGYVNGSLMGYGNGYHELTSNDVTNGVLNHDIVITRNGVDMLTAEKGSPVWTDKDGKMYVQAFDDVVGIQAFDKVDPKDGKKKIGLFSLNKKLNKAGNILVGMNDIHVKSAMADDRVMFIIPWHSSGASSHILSQMLRSLGVDVSDFKPTDYTDMQEEKDMLKKNVGANLISFWNSHKNETDFACGIKGGIESGDGNGGLSKGQLHYRELRDAIIGGVTYDTGKANKDGKPINKTVSLKSAVEAYNNGDNRPEFKTAADMFKEIESDEFLIQSYDKINAVVNDGMMTNGDKKYIYPYEYWDTNSTYDNASVNGERYIEYCRRLGRRPKFSGLWKDDTQLESGNFTNEKGYWKTLIDRRMYDVKGNFQDLDKVDSSGFNGDLIDPAKTNEKYIVTRVADDEGVKKIAENVYKKESERTGTMPQVDYGMKIDSSVKAYKKKLSIKGDDADYESRIEKLSDEYESLNDEDKELRKSLAEKYGSRIWFVGRNKENVDQNDVAAIKESSAKLDAKKKELDKLVNDYEEYQRRESSKKFADEYKKAEEMFSKAEEEYGTTDDYNQAGYILPNGKMLYFGEGGVRGLDHRNIESVIDDDFSTERWRYITKFLNDGGIRIDGNNGSINLSIEPTNDQYKTIKGLVRNSDGNVYIDFDNENGDTVHSVSYDGANPNRVVADIQRYFNDGIKPQGNAKFSKKSSGKGKNESFTDYAKRVLDDYDSKKLYETKESNKRDAENDIESSPKYSRKMTSDDRFEDDPSMSVVDWFNKQDDEGKLMTTYRAVQLDDNGEINSPIASSIQRTKGGKDAGYAKNEPLEYGEVYRSTENPDLVDEKGNIKLNKKDGGTPLDVAYNPYIHSSDSMLNDQFESAWKRNLIVVETEIPTYEIDRPDGERYHAEKAKNSTGMVDDWKAGDVSKNFKEGEERKVYLSRYDRPKREVPVEEVAEFIEEKLKRNGIEGIPFNCLPPNLRDVLHKRGKVKILHPTNSNAGKASLKAYNEWLNNDPTTPNGGGRKYSMKADKDHDVFYSNAERFVEDSKQEKASGEQWLKMIKNGGGLKAGEDKWIGLSKWLTEHSNDKLTKQEVLDYVADHKIKIEEVNYEENGSNPINLVRLNYTTKGLNNKKEIALVVPDVEPYNNEDDIHFGEAGDGRAVAWVRFGDTTDKLETEPMTGRSIMDELEKKYGNADAINKMTTEDKAKRYFANYIVRKDYVSKDEMMEDIALNESAEVALAFDDLVEMSKSGSKVLVIDEIQSKRHQDGREKGYFGNITEEEYEIAWKYLAAESVLERDISRYSGKRLQEENNAKDEARNIIEELSRKHGDSKIKEIVERIGNPSNGVPDAPFDKNWSELAMKRMIRYAADNGYDKIAWTTGIQQAERYDIGHEVSSVKIKEDNDNEMKIAKIYDRNGNYYSGFRFYDDGLIEGGEFDGKNINDVLGNELSSKVLSAKVGDEISGDGLSFGGEGMKSFYDNMLTSFVNKYGKKFGVKVEDIFLPNVERSAQTMHSIDVPESMKESVKKGQPMFSKKGDVTSSDEFKNWFGDWENDPENASKVVDKDGKPLVVYHASPNYGFNVFDTNINKYNVGSHFGTEKAANELWKGHRGIYKVYLDIKNPYETGDIYDFNQAAFMDEIRKAASELRKYDKLRDDVNTFMDKWFPGMHEYPIGMWPKYANSTKWLRENSLWNYDGDYKEIQDEMGALFKNVLKKSGYDGIKYKNDMEDSGSTSWIAFEPEQIKSSEETTYDDNGNEIPIEQRFSSSPDIRYSIKPGAEKKDSKIGRPLYPMNAESEAQKRISELRSVANEIMNNTLLKSGDDANASLVENTVTELKRFISERINKAVGKSMTSTQEKALLRQLDNAAKGNDVEKVRDAVMQIQEVLTDAQMQVDLNELSNMMKMQTEKKNDRGIMEAKGVTLQYAKVFNSIKSTFGSMFAEGVDHAANATNNKEVLDNEVLTAINRVDDAMNNGLEPKEEDLILIYEGQTVRRSMIDAESVIADMEEAKRECEKAEEDLMSIRSSAVFKSAAKKAKLGKQLKSFERQAINQERVALDLLHSAQEDYLQRKREVANKIYETNQTMKGFIGNGREAMADYRKKQLEHRAELLKMAKRDFKRTSSKSEGEEGVRSGLSKWMQEKWDGLNSTAYSLDYLLGNVRNHYSREGELYDYFFLNPETSIITAEGEKSRGLFSYGRTLDDAVADIFGRKRVNGSDNKNFNWLREDSDKLIGKVTRTITPEDANKFNKHKKDNREDWTEYVDEFEMQGMTKGNALYAWLSWQQPDGKMKLIRQGYTDETIKQIEDALGKEYIEFGKFMTKKFLPELRATRYNPRHEQMYGTSMADNPNYFPLKIDKSELKPADVIGQEQAQFLPSTVTPYTINRRRNTSKLDIIASETSNGTNALDVIRDYGECMEQWYNMAPVINDFNVLFASKSLKQIMEHERHGSFKMLAKAAQVATGSLYLTKGNEHKFINHFISSYAKGAIGYRLMTAAKQITSYPAFWAYSLDPEYQFDLLVNLSSFSKNGDNTIRWAKDNLPLFAQRTRNGDLGLEGYNDRLFDGAGANRLFKNGEDLVDSYGKYGMWANRKVDQYTIAAGAKAVYDCAMRKLKDRGYSSEEAHKRAVIEAQIVYNESQQSSVNAFSSYAQKNPYSLMRSLTLFRNASIGYGRMLRSGIKDMAKAYMGVNDENNMDLSTAKRWRKFFGGLSSAVIFGSVLPSVWGLAGSTSLTPSLVQSIKNLSMDDDELNKLLATSNALGVLTDGTILGSPMTAIAAGFEYKPYPFFDELNKLVKKVNNDGIDNPEVWSYAIKQAAMFGVGFNLDTWNNAIEGAVDIAANVSNGDVPPDAFIDMALIFNMNKSDRQRWGKFIYSKYGPLTYAKAYERLSAKELEDRKTMEVARQYCDGINPYVARKMVKINDFAKEFEKAYKDGDINKVSELMKDDMYKYYNTGMNVYYNALLRDISGQIKEGKYDVNAYSSGLSAVEKVLRSLDK